MGVKNHNTDVNKGEDLSRGYLLKNIEKSFGGEAVVIGH